MKLQIRQNFPPVICHLYFYENLLNFHKIESYEASRKLVYNFLADARKTTDKLGFCLIFLQVKRIFHAYIHCSSNEIIKSPKVYTKNLAKR